MKNEFIPYEQALALKELGFDEQCFSFYNANGELYESEGYYRYSHNVHKDEVIAPIYQQAFRWFREKYNLKYWVEEHTEDTFIYEIRPHKLSDYKEGEIYVYKTYEETELACLKKLIEISTQSKSENEELTPHIKYHNNGNVYIKGQKNSKGQEEGLWELFDFNGNIRLRIPFKEGKEDGIEEVFGENGNIKWRTSYKKGKQDGIEEMFYDNGNIESRTSYKDGKIDGIAEEFDEQGNITETYLWKDGELIKTTKH
jgi:antitoxin component YwqK of YwqJK toxin-antitoxin module